MALLLKLDYSSHNVDHRTAFFTDGAADEKKMRIFHAVCESDPVGVLKYLADWQAINTELIEFDEYEDDITSLLAIFGEDNRFPDFPLEVVVDIVSNKKYVKETLNGIADFSEVAANDEEEPEEEVTTDNYGSSYTCEELSDALDNDSDNSGD